MSERPAIDPGQPLALFLDLDGTLIEIAARPDLVQVPPRLLRALETAHKHLDGALALISGRTVADLDILVAPLRLPAAGVHGLEYRNGAGQLHVLSAERMPDYVQRRLADLATHHPGLILEKKGRSLAVHYRQAPEIGDRLRAELAALQAELGAGFIVQEGKMVLELRPAGASKGTAIARFMGEPPFAGRRPVFIGDDVTDEDGFRTVNEMDGLSIRVGPTHASAARYGLADVGAVLDWLESICAQRCEA